MINNLENFLLPENIYLIANWGIIPFWLLLIFMPSNGITKFLSHSIIAPLLLLFAYGFIGYNIYLGQNILGSFNLYLGLDDLYGVFSDENFLLIFWLHFLAISLFLGSWISRDGQRHLVPKFVVGVCLIITYFTGPLGILIYWFIRIFYSKKISFNE